MAQLKLNKAQRLASAASVTSHQCQRPARAESGFKLLVKLLLQKGKLNAPSKELITVNQLKKPMKKT